MRSLLLLFFFVSSSAQAVEIFNLNVFDQLQGSWDDGFRARRMSAVANFVKERRPDLVVFQEARGNLPGEVGGGKDSADAAALKKIYPHRFYLHEMTGADGASYGYWMGAKVKPRRWIRDGFSFPGGVERKVQAAIFGPKERCLGVLSLHLSYQTSEVRVREATWLLAWLKGHERVCRRWMVLGDFNADETSEEMKVLFAGGLTPLFSDLKPTVGAFNPIRRIYGENTPSRTIDWALGWNTLGHAEVVLDSPYHGEWVSDHAGIYLTLNKGDKK